MHCCTVTAGGARRVPCWHRYSQLKPSDPWDRWAHFWGYFCRYWDGQREHGNNQPARPTQQNLRGRPPLRILLALESATQACRRGVKHRCWEQQSAWQQAERLLWAHAAPFKVSLVKRHRTCCNGTQWTVGPPADHSKCLLLSLTNSSGLCTDSWLNSNQGKAITIFQLRGRHYSGHHLPGFTRTPLGKSMGQRTAPD